MGIVGNAQAAYDNYYSALSKILVKYNLDNNYHTTGVSNSSADLISNNLTADCEKPDFYTELKIRPLQDHTRKLIKGESYQVYISAKHYPPSDATSDLVHTVDGSTVSNFKTACGEYFTSDDWEFTLDNTCTDAEVEATFNGGNAIIKINNATANLTTKCTLTATSHKLPDEVAYRA